MAWALVEDTAGSFTIRLDGVDVGTFSLLPNAPHTGRGLYPSIRAGLVASTFNEMDATLTNDIAVRYRSAGWESQAAYRAQVDAIKAITADLPPDVRAEIQTAFVRHGWTEPITVDQMALWQDEILTIATDAEVAA